MYLTAGVRQIHQVGVVRAGVCVLWDRRATTADTQSAVAWSWSRRVYCSA